METIIIAVEILDLLDSARHPFRIEFLKPEHQAKSKVELMTKIAFAAQSVPYSPENCPEIPWH